MYVLSDWLKFYACISFQNILQFTSGYRQLLITHAIATYKFQNIQNYLSRETMLWQNRK